MKIKKMIYLVVELLCAAVFFYAAAQIYFAFQDYHQAEKEYDALSEKAVTVREIPADEKDENNGTEIQKYYVDLDAVKTENPDTAGWIILPDSKINYPIVKSKDNEDYLRTSFEGNPATAGTIFIEKNCRADFSDQNTIIYGHNMRNGSMFRALNDLTDREFFENHRIFLLSTGEELEEYGIISCYETTTEDSSSWQISFPSDAEYELWLKNMAKRCRYDCMPYDAEKNTVTLSTCRGKSGGPGRFIVHLQKKTEGGE